MVVISKLLHPLFQRLRYQVLHLLRGCARPCRRHRKDLDREAWIFGAAQLEIGKRPGNDHCKKKEEGDGTFPYRERRKIEALLRIPLLLETWSPELEVAHWMDPFASARRTCCPSLRRCAPSATTSSPGFTPSARTASSSPKRSTLTGRNETVEVFVFNAQTPGPLPRSIMEAIGTSEGSEVCVPAGSSIVTVAPSGAFASTPSRTYRASKVRVSESAASESCLKRAGTCGFTVQRGAHN